MLIKNHLLIFYLTTLLGSALTSFTVYLSIEKYFYHAEYLMIALILGTLSSAIFSCMMPWFLRIFGIKNGFSYSQIFGIFFVFIIAIGFYLKNVILVLLGIAFVNLPSCAAAILLTITLKSAADSDMDYRNYSGRREFIFGSARMIAAFFTPVLLHWFSLYVIFFIDILSYLISWFYLFKINFSKLESADFSSYTFRFNQFVFKTKETWLFAIQSGAALLLVALIPILASSTHIVFTQNLSEVYRGWLWMIDSMAIILGNYAYLHLVKHGRINFPRSILMLSSLCLIPLVFTQNIFVLITVCVTISTLFCIAFSILRDDYVIKAGNDLLKIASYSSFSMLQKYLLFSISPILLTFLFTTKNIFFAITSLVSLQFLLLILTCFFKISPKRSVI